MGKIKNIVIYCIFPIIYDFGESKSRLAKVADTESFEEMKNKKLRDIRVRNTFIYKYDTSFLLVGG